MKCEFCEFARECKDPAQYGGGCDIDGADDFGCDFGDDSAEGEEETISGNGAGINKGENNK